ncbi:MAG: DUF1853 family protein [Xanthomarina sp.]
MTKIINAQYQGYLNTPNLWFGNTVYNLEQLELPSLQAKSFDETLPKNIRLGKRVEQFVFYELKQNPKILIVFENLQIQQKKLTIGEMDALILIKNKPVHLEIIYKFYVYEDTAGISELNHWIGPNRKDSLIEKLDKLKNKQLPLLYHFETLKHLHKQHLNREEIEQKVLFKAQLFVPHNKKIPDFNLINPECIVGFYLKKEELSQFTNSKFYIPNKPNWLLKPQAQVAWLSYNTFIAKLHPVLENKTSLLVWIKHTNGEIHKCFILWW